MIVVLWSAISHMISLRVLGDGLPGFRARRMHETCIWDCRNQRWETLK